MGNRTLSLVRYILVTLPALIVWHGPRRGVSAAVRGVLWCLRWVWSGICAQGRLLRSSPFAFYRMLARRRDWVLAKVDFAHTESAKFRACWTAIKLPYNGLRAVGLNPQAAIGLLIAGGTVGGGVAINETVFAEKSFSRGDPGHYEAPSDLPTTYSEESNTLRIDLGNTSVKLIEITDISLGSIFTGSALPSGESTVVSIGGNPSASGFTGTRLEVGHLIFEKSRCKKLTLDDIQTHTLIVEGNASDGMSLSPGPGSLMSHRMRAISGGFQQAAEMRTQGGSYDRLWVQSPVSGVNGRVEKLVLRNLYTSGGECLLKRITAGTIEIRLNEIGYSSGGFSTKEFVISPTVTAANIILTDNVEVTIVEPSPS